MDRKMAIVSGASRGIGLEFTRQLLQKECFVVATARNLANDELKNLTQEFPDQLQLEVLDVGDDRSTESFTKKLKISHLDLLISNAGIIGGENTNLKNASSKDLLESFNINSIGPLRLARNLLPLLEKASHPIVANITSLMGSIADNKSGGYYAYRMSKAALNMFNKSFSIDFPKITSVVLHPGWVKTDMGGPNAHITSERSVSRMLSIIENLKSKDSGKFFSFDGRELPW
ncbi:MAG: short-chain dehydrogenase [Bacteriovoracaceae bacterium]|nr:short-chain dehydrogenase [Bacteriovoracaceae bacterium]